MASLPDTFPLRPSLASGLKNALEVYGHITPPNEHDDSDCTRFISRCLVELNEEQRRYNERLQVVEFNTNRGSQNDETTFSSIDDKVDAIWEEIGELKSKVGNIEDKVLSIEDAVVKMKDDILEIDSKIDDSEACLIHSIEQLEKNVDGRFSDLESKVDLLEVKFDKVMFEQEVWGLRQRNGLADRLYQPVQLVGRSYIDADGKPVLKSPTWPVKSVGYYWKMHNSENHKRLVDMHLFYQLDFRHWALSNDEASDNSYETDDLDLPVATLEQAVSMYPDRAVMALFNELGLVYSRFQEQVERQQLRPTVLQKRSPTSSRLERRTKRPSDGSTIDLIPVPTSPTASGS
jgi:hypothetical protein